MHVDAAVAFAGDRAGHIVANAERAVALALAFAQCRKRIGCLAALADDESEGVFVERHVPVAEFAGDLHLRGQRGERLHGVFADDRRVVGCATADENDTLDLAQFAGRHVQSAELGRRFFGRESSAHGIAHRRGLLVDFLEHVVRIIPLGSFLRIEIHRAYLVVLPVPGQGLDLEIVGTKQDNLEIFEINDVARVVDQRQRVAGQKVLALADAEDERTAAPRADEQVRHIAMHHRDPVSPVHLAQGHPHRLDQMISRGLAELDGELPDKVRQHLGVRLG